MHPWRPGQRLPVLRVHLQQVEGGLEQEGAGGEEEIEARVPGAEPQVEHRQPEEHLDPESKTSSAEA